MQQLIKEGKAGSNGLKSNESLSSEGKVAQKLDYQSKNKKWEPHPIKSQFC